VGGGGNRKGGRTDQKNGVTGVDVSDVRKKMSRKPEGDVRRGCHETNETGGIGPYDWGVLPKSR